MLLEAHKVHSPKQTENQGKERRQKVERLRELGMDDIWIFMPVIDADPHLSESA